MKQAIFYAGRLLQLFGMFELLVDIVTAGPLGPSPKIFTVGIIVFVVGWGMTRLTR